MRIIAITARRTRTDQSQRQKTPQPKGKKGDEEGERTRDDCGENEPRLSLSDACFDAITEPSKERDQRKGFSLLDQTQTKRWKECEKRFKREGERERERKQIRGEKTQL